METTLVDGAWSEPTVAPFSGQYPDIDPWVSPDGQSIYFSSIRPVEGDSGADAELFRVDREGDGWGEAVHLAALGSDGDELGASVSADGSIWFASDRRGGAGGWDLYTAQPAADGFGDPAPVGALNSPIWEFNPAIDPDGTTLVFTSINREGGSGLGDLFVATRDGDTWSDPRPLAVNSSADEYHASLSPDGTTLYFVRRTAQGDLHEAPWPAADPGS
jgi:Tol biopolymer transport system component